MVSPAILRLAPLALWAGSLCACSSEPADSGAGSGGSAGSGPTELEVHPGNFLAEDAPMVMLGDGDLVQLSRAVQGGWVIYIGAQVKNLAGDQARIHTRLIDPDTGAVRKEDERTIVMKAVNGQPELKQPDLRSRSQVSHLWVCPNEEPRDIIGQEWLVEVNMAATDDSSSGQATVRVTGTCMQTDPSLDSQCECECKGGYVFGNCP